MRRSCLDSCAKTPNIEMHTIHSLTGSITAQLSPRTQAPGLLHCSLWISLSLVCSTDTHSCSKNCKGHNHHRHVSQRQRGRDSVQFCRKKFYLYLGVVTFNKEGGKPREHRMLVRMFTECVSYFFARLRRTLTLRVAKAVAG